MTRLRLLPVMLASLVVAAPAAAQTISSACKPARDAMTKVITIDHATSTVMKNTTIQQITAGGANYIQVSGAWTKSPLSPDDLLKQSQENLKNAKVYACKVLPDELVGGAAAAVYSAHEETAHGTVDSKLWISKATGLPLKTESDLGNGDRLVATYSYANIKAPAVK